ncbi:hypothetical protein DB30_06717 [Enhygromyxa salina]|uniref:DUF6484 domain-containing protein n=1 Tax=Enhygromyxa salina TaxID=215803 RepID=A0A0C2CXW8_9BACT|nr:DUF6484 domain-containing protein [Enhygromyxa salina]KIG14490.1 hypothetical protein DB30_06717 [Enhygromyxa salina]
MSESANPDSDAPADAPPPSDEAIDGTRDGPGVGPAGDAAPTSPGLLAELLEGARDPSNPQAGSQPRPATASAHPVFGTRVGWLVEWASGSAPTVDFPGNELGPLAARSVIPLDPNLVATAIAEQRGVMISFEDGRPRAPIITGLLQPVVFEVEAEIATEADADAEAASEDADRQTSEALPAMQANVDGRRVEIEAADEIVLKCGQASIVLRRNGRVVIRGTYVETRSRGVNRIKGGSVQIN